MLSEHNKQHHRKVLLSNFHPNCSHFIGKNLIQRLSGGVGRWRNYLSSAPAFIKGPYCVI